MATPTCTLEYAATAGPLDPSPTWTTIAADDVLSIAIDTGRQSETDRTTQPSTMAVRLDNSGRTYDPALNANLLPSRQVRLTVTHEAVDYVLFRGVVNIDGWQQVEYEHPAVSSCLINCIDLLGHVSQRTADFPLMETKLYQLAIDKGQISSSITPSSNRVRHYPLGDNSDEDYYGAATYDIDTYWGSGTQPSFVLFDGPSATQECLPSQVYSDEAVRAVNGGSLDGWLGAGIIRTFAGNPNSSSTLNAQAEWSVGVGMKLRSLPATDRTPILAGLTTTTHGLFLNRDGSLVFSANTTPDDITSPAGTLKPGQRYFVGVTWDGTAGGSLGVLRLYVNGVEVASSTTYVTTSSFSSLGLLYLLGAYPGVTARMDVLYSDQWSIPAELSASEMSQLYDLWLGAAGVKTGRAVGLLCDAIGLPHGVDPDAGRISVQELLETRPNVANLLQAVERTEGGRIYYDHRNEQVAMVSWADLATATRHTVPQLKLSDDPAETGDFVRYSNPQVVTLKPITKATVTADSLTDTTVDLDARAAYGDQSISYSVLSNPLLDASSMSGTEVLRNSTPTTAVRSLTLNPTTTEDFELVLDLELFDLVELTRKPHNTGAQQTINCTVEGASFIIGAGLNDWEAVLFLALTPDQDPGLWDTLRWGIGSDDYGRLQA